MGNLADEARTDIESYHRTVNTTDRTPPPITPARPPRLALFRFRHYLRAPVAGSSEQNLPSATSPHDVRNETRRYRQQP
jgi:hypothetical protein